MIAQKVRPSELLALVGALILFVATFFAWFALPPLTELRELAPNASVVGGGDPGAIDLNVWDLHFARWFIYLSILLAVCMFLAALLSRTADWSMILATPVTVFSGIAMLCMVFRTFNAPRDFADPTAWFYVGLVGSMILFASACWAIRDETVPTGFDKPPRPDLIEVE